MRLTRRMHIGIIPDYSAMRCSAYAVEGGMKMGFGEGILVALFVMSLVFVLLAAIYGLVKLSSAVIRRYFRTENV